MVPESAQQEAAAQEWEARLENSAPDGMLDVDGMEGKEEAGDEDGTGVGESMMEVLEFTKSLLFKVRRPPCSDLEPVC